MLAHPDPGTRRVEISPPEAVNWACVQPHIRLHRGGPHAHGASCATRGVRPSNKEHTQSRRHTRPQEHHFAHMKSLSAGMGAHVLRVGPASTSGSDGGTRPKCNFTGTSSWSESTRTSLTPRRLDARPGGYGRRVQGRHHSGQSGSKGVRLQCLRLPRSGATTLGARGPRGCQRTILLELLPSQVEVKMQAGEGGSGSGGGPGCGAPQTEVEVPCLRDTHIPPTPIPHPTTTTYTTPPSPSPHPPPISIHSSVHGRFLPVCRHGPLVAHKSTSSSWSLASYLRGPSLGDGPRSDLCKAVRRHSYTKWRY